MNNQVRQTVRLEDMERLMDYILEKAKQNKTNMCGQYLFLIERKLKQLRGDKQFLDLLSKHMHFVQSYPELPTWAQAVQKAVSVIFISKFHLYPSYESVFLEDYAEPIVSIPIEVFEDNQSKVKDFLTSLQRSDILIVQVEDNNHAVDPLTNLGNIKLIKTRVVVKLESNGGYKYVYGIHAKVYLFASEEYKRFSVIEVGKYMKVQVLGCLEAMKKCFATCKPCPEHKLGFIGEDDFPFDLKSVFIASSSNYATYSHYLRSHPNFYHVQYLKEDIVSLGNDLHRVYSFIENMDNVDLPPDQCLKALEEKAKQDMQIDSHKHLQGACKYVENKDYMKALEEFEEAIQCWPRNPKVFEQRGIMYCKMMTTADKSYREKAIHDFETALKLNPSSIEVKQEYAKLILGRAKYLAKHKDYEEARNLVSKALRLNQHSEEGKKLEKYVEKKLALEEIKELERKRAEIQQQIKLEK